MAAPEHPIHAAIADALEARVPDGGLIADLGCGEGATLGALARPGRRLLGLDRNVDRLGAARELLGNGPQLVRHDLDQPLPLTDATVDAAICHNVIEELDDPAHLLAQIHRVLRPTGVAVLSHTDFGSLTIDATDKQRCQRVLAAYAQITPSWMPRADAWMGRRLPGLVKASPLTVEQVHPVVLLSTRLSDPRVNDRVHEVARSLRRAHKRGTDTGIAPDELDAWTADLIALDKAGRFFFSETAFYVIATVG